MPSHPVAPKRPKSLSQHGHTRLDNYFWLRDREDPETLKYLQAEIDYLDEMTQHTRTLREKLFVEMKGRIKEDDVTVPEKRGNYYYYLRHEQGKQYPIFCRKKGSLNAAEEILLDQNQLAEGRTFCSVAAFSVSPDGNKLLYSVDFEGREVYTLRIKDLVSGQAYPEEIGNTSGSAYERGGAEWANDSRHIFYVTLDDAQRSCKVHRHDLGTDPAQDALLCHETDEAFSVFLFKSRDDTFLMTYHYSTNTREMRFLPADHPLEELRVLQPRIAGLEYFAAHRHGKFYIVNNYNAKNFKLSVANTDSTDMQHWADVIPHRPDVLVEGVDTFEKYLVLQERSGGLKQIRVSPVEDPGQARYVPFPEPAYNVTLEANPEFDTDLLRFHYSSFITPPSIIDFHMDSGEWELKKEDEIPSGLNKADYICERIHATAPDGTRVPLSIVYRRDRPRDGSQPALLYGYGSYGATIDAWFNPNLFSLIDRGFVYGIAHIRGGSDMGREWYENGKMLNKKNTFTDFIACAEVLIQEKYTSKDKLSIIGVSAGGLLVSACLTMRPDLFKAVVAKVPFVDVVSTMNDPSIPLTTLEYDQWGNPADQEYYDYMLSYSPYDNLRAAEYPDILISTGLNDPRVAYWEPAKFAAKLRELKTDDNLVLLYTNFDSGHAGASGRYDYLKEVAREYAFLIDRLT